MKLSELKPGQCFRYLGILHVVIHSTHIDRGLIDKPVPTLCIDNEDVIPAWSVARFMDEEMGEEYELVEDF